MAKQAATKPNLQYESPDNLDFDHTNPRFGGLMKDASQEGIHKALMAEPYYAGELIDSLHANGFIDYEPLVVKRNGARAGCQRAGRLQLQLRRTVDGKPKCLESSTGCPN